MLDTSSRLLRLLWLLQSRRSFTGEELAARLEIDARTVRRDIGRLRNLGYDVEATGGPAGGYRMGARTTVPPLQLDDDEAVAVAVGLSTATGSVSGLAEVSLQLLAKLEQALPDRLRKRVEALRSTTLSLRSSSSDAATAEVLTTLATACRDRLSTRFSYRAHGGDESRRHVDPYRLGYTGRRWYLVAFDRDRDDWRTFRVDRVASQPTLGTPFTPLPVTDEELTARLRDAISTAPYAQSGVVILHAPMEELESRLSPAAGTLERLDDARCRLTTAAHSFEALAFFIAMLGVDFEIESPDELRGYVAALGERCVRAAGAPAASRTEPVHDAS